LQQLAIEVQQLQSQTEAWQVAMRELIQAIHLSGKLARPGRLPPDLYNEAVNETVLWMYRQIQNYDSNRGEFMAWVNYRLSMVERGITQKQSDPYVQSIQGRMIRTKHQISALVKRIRLSDLLHWIELHIRRLIPDFSISSTMIIVLSLVVQVKQHPILLEKLTQASIAAFPKLIQNADAESLESIPQPESSSLAMMLEQYIVDDPDQLLQQRRMRDRPDITLQMILQELFIHDRQWKEISTIYQVGIPTLSNFYQRSLKSLAPKIRKAIQGEFEAGR
ncbi:MAG: hypothetical protein WCA35_12190, partial [Kovacikia sp.]